MEAATFAPVRVGQFALPALIKIAPTVPLDCFRFLRERWTGAAATTFCVKTAAAEAGMSTAEYAVGTIAACGFAAVLYKIVTSGPVRSALTAVIEKALHAPF